MKKETPMDLFRQSLISPLILPKGSPIIECHFKYKLAVTPEEIWPYVIDTSRMNKEMGFGGRIENEIDGENHVTTETLGRAEHWIEKPWVWVDKQELQNHRVFIKGWMTEQKAAFKLQQTSEGVIVHAYFVWAFPNIFNKLLFLMARGVLDKKFSAFFKAKEELIISERTKQSEKLIEMNEPVSPKEALVHYIKTADELDLTRLHLKKIATIIKVPYETLLDASKTLVDEGYLTLSWDVVCPHCRGVRAENKSAVDIDYLNSCDACEIEFTIDSVESVEIIFHPTAKIREVKKVVYCAAEPAKKSHIKLNQRIQPNESRKFNLSLPEGNYRARTTKSFKPISLQLRKGSGKVEAFWDGSFQEEIVLSPNFEFSVSNPFQEEIVLTIEEAWWEKDLIFPGEILSHPSLRELFTNDHLKLGVKLNVGNQVILFTDIVGSTPFYKSSGDVKAFKAVQDHYQEVSSIIKSHRGAVVKYIGDAVMAAFLDLASAFECSVELHRKFHPYREDTPIKLRSSLGLGPVLCANINVGLDYFGNTVNQAAKIQKWAGSHEIAISSEDWLKIHEKFPELSPDRSQKDEKLDVLVQVIKVA